MGKPTHVAYLFFDIPVVFVFQIIFSSLDIDPELA